MDDPYLSARVNQNTDFGYQGTEGRGLDFKNFTVWQECIDNFALDRNLKPEFRGSGKKTVLRFPDPKPGTSGSCH